MPFRLPSLKHPSPGLNRDDAKSSPGLEGSKLRRGFTLVEVLIFLLLILALTMVLLTSAGSINKTKSTNLSGIAAKIASCEMERLKTLDFSSLPAVGTAPIGNPCDVDLNEKLPEPKSANTTIENYQSDANIKQIKIEISWTESNVTQYFKLSTLKSKYGI